MFPLKNGEVLVEEGLERLEFVLRSDLALAVVGCVDQMINDLRANVG